MAHHGPVGAGNVTLIDGLVPAAAQIVGRRVLRKPLDNALMALVACLVEQLAGEIALSCRPYTVAMQGVVCRLFRVEGVELREDLAQLSRRQTGADNRAMERGIKLPSPQSQRRARNRDLRLIKVGDCQSGRLSVV